jgi:endonuclease III
MEKKAKALIISKVLNKKFPHPKIPLRHKSAYTLLIATLLSAQCTDERVNKVTPHLFAIANTPKKMIELTVKQIEKIIHSCGFAPTKSKAIWNLSKILVEEYSSRVPKTFEELEKLPGVGHKTASVVMSHSFNIPAFPVDTHIYRCAHRWGLTTAKTYKKTEEDLKELFPKRIWNKLHLQLLYYARTICKARGHDIDKCEICQKIKD